MHGSLMRKLRPGLTPGESSWMVLSSRCWGMSWVGTTGPDSELHILRLKPLPGRDSMASACEEELYLPVFAFGWIGATRAPA